MRFGLFLCLLALGCGDDDGRPAADAGRDAGDAAAVDAGGDAGVSDADVSDADMSDAATDASVSDAATDAGMGDAGAADAASDAGADADDAGADSGVTRTTVLASFCPSMSMSTPAGFYRGTLGSNLNDIAGACGLSAPGRDGSLRVEVAPGQTLRAVYRHDGDGILYLLDSCPVVGSCLAGSDTSSSGPETIEWTNGAATPNSVFLVLDSDSLAGPQTFELDLFLTP